MPTAFKLVVFHTASDLSGKTAEELLGDQNETLQVIIQHRSSNAHDDQTFRTLEETGAAFHVINEGIIGVFKLSLGAEDKGPTHLRAQISRMGTIRQVCSLSSAYPWSIPLKTLPEVSYWTVIRGRDGEMFIRPGKDVEELILSSLESDADKNLVLASKDDLALYMLERLQSLLDGTANTTSPSDSSNRHRIRRLLVRLCLDSGILPPSLLLTGIKCEDTDPVGMGGYADIFRGTYEGGRVALKRLRVFLSVVGSQHLFLREALVWRHLRHPHILPFLGIDQVTFKSQLCMVLPWMQYGDINQCMKALQDGGDEIPYLRWVTEIGQGMAYLHNEHVVHADLRGANILIDETLGVRLSDFGLSKFADSTTASRGSHAGGALRWMSPEILIDGNEPDYASDVYAFGCVCLEVYSQSRPFPALNDAQVIVRIMRKERPPRIKMKSGEDIPDDLWHLITNCWSSEVTLRPGMNELVTSLLSLSAQGSKPDAEMVDQSQPTFSETLDPAVVSLVQNAYGSTLYQQLILAARGDLSDKLMCSMQDTLDQYSRQDVTIRPPYFQFLRSLLLKLASKSRALPSSLLIPGVHDLHAHGSTGISDIYIATYEGRKVALKRVRNSQSPHESNLFDALCRETLIWRQLKHPNILPFIGTCNIQLNFEPRLCLVSPWAEKGNVTTYFWELCDQLIPDEKKVAYLRQWILDVAMALEYIHKEHIVHADVRVGNVFVDDHMRAQLAHFNVSFFAEESQFTTLGGQKQYGSEWIRWMAPELRDRASEPTYATDVYSFGCLCIEMFIGDEIYSLHWDNDPSMAPFDRRPPRPTGKNDSVAMPDDLWELAERCWVGPVERLTMSDVVATLLRNQ
ncbi:kinase-like domain-containing protein [Cristinia sonorae]|uniref:Kinase-like domain-containing protein n=1 Tax=Cristinia sonorae TaxID=1940300 RepID=A0A8K0UEC7_9AGAR|nr:kinase-like domain-containing protein [Cristinia sonorae]